MQQTKIAIRALTPWLSSSAGLKYTCRIIAVAIQVTGGGSGVGIAALINGTTDIATSAGPLNHWG
jgi:ABC-type phosphate transport system substrate-binding protein